MVDLPRNPAPPVYRTATEPKLGLLIPLVVACALFMENLDSTIIATSIPQIARSLNEPPLHLNLAVTSYLLSLAVFIPVSGWIADRFGARNVFCGAIVLFTVGSALCGLSTSLAMMVATRILQGFGGAMMTPVGRLILLRSFPKEGLVRAMSYVTIPALIGPTMGPIVGGFLTTYASWRWIFYINIPIGLFGIFLALRYCENYRMPAPPRFDFTGFVICGAALASTELVLESAGRHMVPAWGEATLAAVAVAGMALYGRHARRTPSPAVDLKVFRLRTFRLSVLAGGVCRMGLGAVPFLLPLQLQLGFGLTAMQSGAITFVSSLGAILMKSASQRILRRFGFRNLLIGNGLLVGFVITGLAAFTAATPHVLLYAYLLLFGFMRSVQFTCFNTLGYADVPTDMMSRATSVSSVGQQLSMSFGVALGATLLGLLVGPEGTVTAAEFHIVYPLVAVLPFIGSLFFFQLRPSDGTQVSGYRPRDAALPPIAQPQVASAKPAASSNAPAP
ncbi:MFS transporter [Aliidongia dinghuensis]|uniref:MFS transporter n=1 Tax=Aliidongia dinghuensis TaxID=1867774 RepID=A0A8J2YTF1_9PROT|nr:DHA2 family efflux MFS transporter permease subunit [Aliidongia dinghuensis]GGF18664.1 MFS transporter [Aliidongia dinghuensis]